MEDAGPSQRLRAPSPLDAAAGADAVRRRLHGNRTTFTLVRTLDLTGTADENPINGIELETRDRLRAPGEGDPHPAPAGSRSPLRSPSALRSPSPRPSPPPVDFPSAGDLAAFLQRRAHPAAGDYQILLPAAIPCTTLAEFARSARESIERLMERAAGGDHEEAGMYLAPDASLSSEPSQHPDTSQRSDASPPSEPSPPRPAPTFQLGVADTWIEGEVDVATLEAARREGLRILSDGVRPAHHPAHGKQAARRWEEFWRKAAAAGLRGNTTVLFGPAHDLDAVLRQLDEISRLQRETRVFQSLTPVVFDPDGCDGLLDRPLTQGQFDLRVLAACRLHETGIEHLRMSYARSGLKMAHLSLAGGVDDLEGPLFDGERMPKEVADSFDLSLDEMVRWLDEVGYTPVLRNGAFELLGQ